MKNICPYTTMQRPCPKDLLGEGRAPFISLSARFDENAAAKGFFGAKTNRSGV